MRNWTNFTKVIIAGVILITLAIYVNNVINNYKYYIRTNNNGYYKTNSYVEKGNCIIFKDEMGDKITVCGQYSIRTKK
jgi:hypothetical protein